VPFPAFTNFILFAFQIGLKLKKDALNASSKLHILELLD
jgi:hypothetical protein